MLKNKFITTEGTEITEEEGADELTGIIIGAAIDVHRSLGPGLLESAYEACLIYELRLRKLVVEHQKPLPIFYKDVLLDCGYRLDLVIEKQVIVEVKSIAGFAPIHEAQLLSYLKLSDCKRGLLLNFNVVMLRDGIRRMKI
jgi:GxxExxY protein